MTPFAEMTATDWTVVVGAVFIGLTALLNIWITHLKSSRLEAKADVAANAAEDAARLARVATDTDAHRSAVVSRKLDCLSSDGQERAAIGKENLEVTHKIYVLSNGEKSALLAGMAARSKHLADATGSQEHKTLAAIDAANADDHAKKLAEANKAAHK